ncbi:hypothetical protein RSOLAG22IIIB_07597 [Rhizoctonia solani]|uniref:Delta-endotoxin CytB n=1 Tax=Rhizoctonia solani TaxID=456999 RepID=A0A0K6FNS5_9AGAM|nr:hypothetical protein RSOLAG22IIIB_07597 [Rhizoctonia solani]
MSSHLSSIQGQESTRFVWDVLSTLPLSLQHAGAQVVRFASDYVSHDETKGVKSFDWTKFKNAVDDLETVDLVIDGYTSSSIDSALVAQLPTPVASALATRLKMPTTVTESDIAQMVQEVLERLDYAKQDGVAHFRLIPTDSKTKPESVWEYRLLMMAPNPNVSNDFYAQVAVLEVKAHKKHESDWSPLKDDLQATSVKIAMMKLAATKGFRRPVPITTSSQA